MKVKILIIFWLISVASPLWLVNAYAVETVTIGILAFRPKPDKLVKWAHLSDALNRDIIDYHFDIKLMNYNELEQAVADRSLDFVLTNPGHYVLMQNQYGLSSTLATLVKNIHGQAVSAFGGVIFTRADNKNIQQLKDIAQHKIATVKISSFGGYQMQVFELIENQLPAPDKSQLIITGMPHDNVLKAVLNGQADVGFVRTGILESMQKEGKLDFEQVKVLHPQNLSDFPYKSSTNLYPEWPLSALPHVGLDLKTIVLGYLLSLPHDGELVLSIGLHGFDVSANYLSVEKIVRKLRIPPFDFVPEVSVNDVWHNYKIPIGIMALLIIFISLILAVLWAVNLRLVHTRRELFQHKESLSNIIWGTQVGTWEWNVKTGETIFNERWAEILGYTLSEISPLSIQTWKDMTHPDDLKTAEQCLQIYFEGKIDFYQTDFRMKHKEGHWVWLNDRGLVTKWNEDGSPLWMSGTHTDISERKKNEQKIYRGHRLIEQSLNEIYLFDKTTLFVVDANKAAKNNLGYSMQELSKLTPFDIQPEITEEKFSNIIEPLVCGTKKELIFCTEHQRKDGSLYPVEVHLQLLEDEQPVFIAFIHDITERKNTEIKLEQLNNSLKIKVKKELEKNKQQQLLMLQQSKLAQMGEMIAMIAHQWRQPLNNLAILTQTIAFKYAHGKLNESLMDNFNLNSNKAIQGMSKTIDDFRNFFKPGKEKNNYCVNDVIEQTLNMLNPTFSRYDLCVSFAHEQQYYSNGFSNELGQALINIINNAKDALIEKQIKDKKIAISLEEICIKNHEQESNQIIITISDNAGGVPADIVDKIYDPYFSTKDEKNGTGIGLYMTKLIIDEHLDGSITVSNTKDGANFMISLKACDDQGKN